MKLLIDTHAFIWLDTQSKKLSATALAACKSPDNTLCLSIVSAWEVQIKTQISRLELDVPLPEMIQAQETENALQLLPVELNHVYALGELPLHHNDPFDRLLIAQARAEGASLISIDEQFKNYDVDVIW